MTTDEARTLLIEASRKTIGEAMEAMVQVVRAGVDPYPVVTGYEPSDWLWAQRVVRVEQARDEAIKERQKYAAALYEAIRDRDRVLAERNRVAADVADPLNVKVRVLRAEVERLRAENDAARRLAARWQDTAGNEPTQADPWRGFQGGMNRDWSICGDVLIDKMDEARAALAEGEGDQ